MLMLDIAIPWLQLQVYTVRTLDPGSGSGSGWMTILEVGPFVDNLSLSVSVAN